MYLSVCLHIDRSICACLYIYIYIYTNIYIPICASIYLSIYVFIYLSIYLFIYRSIYRSIYIRVYLFIHACIYWCINPSAVFSLSLYIYIYVSGPCVGAVHGGHAWCGCRTVWGLERMCFCSDQMQQRAVGARSIKIRCDGLGSAGAFEKCSTRSAGFLTPGEHFTHQCTVQTTCAR